MKNEKNKSVMDKILNNVMFGEICWSLFEWSGVDDENISNFRRLKNGIGI
jgi:hypothetical protein